MTEISGIDDQCCPTISVVYGPTIDVSTWSAKYAAGLVPSMWPYGLNLLGSNGIKVTLGHQSRNRSRIPRSKVGPGNENGEYIAMGFDERVAHTVAKHCGFHACGVIWLLEPSPTFRARFRKMRARRSLKKMDLIWCYSQALRSRLVDELNVADSRVLYLPLGVDADFYAAQPYPEDGLVLSVGNDRSRDMKTLYEAFAIMHEAHPETSFVVQSEDPAPSPPFVQRVSRFKDHSELRDYYSRASAVVIATRNNLYTSGSTVALEVQAMARPIVITHSPGMSDYVEDGVSGFLTPIGDPSLLAAAALRVLEDNQLGRRLGLAGSKRVRSSNTTGTMVETLRQEMVRLLQRNRKPM